MCVNPSVEYMRRHREEHQRKLELAREYARGYEDGKRAMSAGEWSDWYFGTREGRASESRIEDALVGHSLGMHTMSETIDRLKETMQCKSRSS